MGAQSHSCVLVFETPWTVARQTPLSMEFSRQEYWSGLLFPTPGDLPDSGMEPASLTLTTGFFTTSAIPSLDNSVITIISIFEARNYIFNWLSPSPIIFES